MTGASLVKGSGKGEGGSRSPTDIDRLVGVNVRKLRIERNLTLAELAAQLGISHQQLQKYETGSNRLSAGTLCNVAETLGVTIEFLFRPNEASSAERQGADALEELRSEGSYLLSRARSEETLRQMVMVLKALSSKS
jgi:transcriptional regulator with XRE-family HTH domain